RRHTRFSRDWSSDVCSSDLETPATLDAERLRHRQLYARDVPVVPDRLEEAVREAEVDQVLHRLLAEEMIDAEDARLVEHLREMRSEEGRVGRELSAAQ